MRIILLPIQRNAEIWHVHGGWSFPIPPDLCASTHPAIWRICEAPSVMIYENGHSAKDTIEGGLRFENFKIVTDITNRVGRHLVLDNHYGRHRLLVRHPRPLVDRGFVVFPDAWCQMRIAAIQYFYQSSGSRSANAGRKIGPSGYQAHRLAVMLKLLDYIGKFSEHAPTIREVAGSIIFPNANFGSAIEWKSSSQRRQTQRLIAEARYMMQTGYRLLLKGQTATTTRLRQWS